MTVAHLVSCVLTSAFDGDNSATSLGEIGRQNFPKGAFSGESESGVRDKGRAVACAVLRFDAVNSRRICEYVTDRFEVSLSTLQHCDEVC